MLRPALFSKQENIVFLPGWGFDVSIWHAMGKSLTPNCYFINFPEITNKTCEIKAVSEKLMIQIPDSSILVGWSLGGLLAINLCATFPDKFEKLVLVASTPKFIGSNQWSGIPLREANHFIYTAQKDFQKAIAKFLKLTVDPFLDLALDAHLNNSLSFKSLLFYLSFLMNTDLRDTYRSLTLPILHLLGGKDAIVPANTIDSLKSTSSHISFKKIEEAGHLPFITHFYVTQKAIKEFILA